MGMTICCRDALLKWSLSPTKHNGDILMILINDKFLKKYYSWSH